MYVCTHAHEYLHAHLHVYREQRGVCVSARCFTRTMPLCTYIHTHINTYMHIYMYIEISKVDLRVYWNMCIGVCVLECVYWNVCIGMCVLECVYWNVCIGMCVHIAIHTFQYTRQHIPSLLHKHHARIDTCTHTHTYMHTHLHAYKDKQRGYVPSRPLAVTQGPCPYTHMHTHT